MEHIAGIEVPSQDYFAALIDSSGPGKGGAGESTHVPYLLPLGLPFLPYGHSGNRSRKLPSLVKKDGVVKVVGQHRHCRLCVRKGAGRILETAGPTSDLEGQSTVALIRHEIYAIVSVREFDVQ